MPPRMNPEEIAMQSLPYPSRKLGSQSRLTQLYTDTKHSSQAAVPRDTDTASPEKRSLDRKYCIQKDRLLAWGFDWTDNLKNSGNIDESVERAGLTEIVESVLENIKSVIEDVESMNVPPTVQPQSSYPSEKHSPAPSHTKRWMEADLLRYEDLIKDMTSAIDLLCDLSRSRRAAHQDETKAEEASEKLGGKKRPSSYQHPFDRPATPVPAYPSQSTPMNQSFTAFEQESASQTTLVTGNPNSIPRISPSILVLPQEGPPGYGDSKTVLRGASSSPRLFGHLRRSNPAETLNTGPDSSLVPVMIEYANFDRLYRETDMELPLSRLEHLHSILCTWDSSFSSALAKPIAYFEDPEHARYGLIFERPYLPHSHQLPAIAPESAYSGQPTTLSTLLHLASKAPSQSSSASVALSPPLEDRFRLAQQLLLGFRFLQQHGFTHRNISSSNIAVLPSNGTGRSSSFDVRRPLICSIDLFSDYDVEPSPEILQQNIYRHPDDPRIKGPTAAPEYDIRFDLYSLSLLLLEIGLWHPLADIYKEKYSLKDFKTRVEKVWIRRLAGRCGSAYTRCVQELFDAGSKFRSKEGARDLMQVLNRVSARLERCCLIDLEEEESEGEEQEEATPFATGNERAVEHYSSHKTDEFVSEPAPANAEGDALDTEQTKKAPARLLFQDLEIPSQILAQYQAFEGQVVRITEKILNRSKESCWIDLLYSGEDKASARPTICIGCSSTKMVRSALKKHLRYDRDLFDLAVFKDTVRRSKSAELHRSKG